MATRPLSSSRSDPAVLAAIALGGALGTLARYGVSQLVPAAEDTFPWATFWTNVSGSFAIGLILALVPSRLAPSSYRLPIVVTGFLGAYTTFSAFAVDIVELTRHGHVPVALANATATVLAGLAAARAGVIGGRALGPTPERDT